MPKPSPVRPFVVERTPAVLFFCHLRWNFVFQRPQHIASRWATDHRVFFWEEPLLDAQRPWLERVKRDGVTVVVPHLAPGSSHEKVLSRLLDELVESERIVDPLLWYWTPMMLPFSRHLSAKRIVWDCMDELSAFAFAPRELVDLEAEMLRCADVVFTGGNALYHHKRDLHPNVHAFPSSVDIDHFAKARDPLISDPDDQAGLPRPRIGWFGVIDERTDIALLDRVASDRPDWTFVMIGPVVKIAPASLPVRPNIHWLGMRTYDQLPAYIAHWDVAILPFAHNAATRFISPTKTPEYLAAGKPVVSTSITDVVRPYGELDLVSIADGWVAFRDAIALALEGDQTSRRARADAYLTGASWEEAVRRMKDQVAAVKETSRLSAAG